MFQTRPLVRIIVCAVAVFGLALTAYAGVVRGNGYDFDPDEPYWISRAAILPLSLSGNFSDPFWNEYFMYANGNGAKWGYGVGMLVQGRMKDATAIGNPPDIYNRFSRYGGAPFPRNDPFYPILTAGRIASAVAAAFAVAFLFVAGALVTGSVWGGMAGAAVFGAHPVFLSVASRAGSDSFFFAAYNAVLALSAAVARGVEADRPQRRTVLVLLGAALAAAVGTKMNGYVLCIVALCAFWHPWLPRPGMWTPIPFGYIAAVAGACAGTYIAMHPNQFGLTPVTPWSLVSDRISATAYHMAYFSTYDPGHVLTAVPVRFAVLWRHLTPGFPWTELVAAAASWCTVSPAVMAGPGRRHIRLWWFVSSVVTLGSLMLYMVFDERRYVLPVLPFIAVASGILAQDIGSGIAVLTRHRHVAQ